MHLITGHNVQEHQILLAVINLPYKEGKKRGGGQRAKVNFVMNRNWGNSNRVAKANIWIFSHTSHIIIFPSKANGINSSNQVPCNWLQKDAKKRHMCTKNKDIFFSLQLFPFQGLPQRITAFHFDLFFVSSTLTPDYLHVLLHKNQRYDWSICDISVFSSGTT